MNRKLGAAALVAGVMALAAAGFAIAAEPHPELDAAQAHLQQAKENLEHAAKDFGGHRHLALKHVNEALEEIEKAKAFDKH